MRLPGREPDPASPGSGHKAGSCAWGSLRRRGGFIFCLVPDTAVPAAPCEEEKAVWEAGGLLATVWLCCAAALQAGGGGTHRQTAGDPG